jgi:hypothetical protein
VQHLAHVDAHPGPEQGGHEPVFPEHIHIEGEDRLLKRAEREDQYRLLLDGLFAAVIVSVPLLIAAIAVLQLI